MKQTRLISSNHSAFMTTVRQIDKIMPNMRAHEGIWEGQYYHLGAEGIIEDSHKTRITCEFPETGKYVYIQHNHFIWPDGREYKVQLPAILKDGRLWWDTETFHGSAWETHDGIILLNLERKDIAGARFFEMITMGASGKKRARTWHWFKDGALFRCTLCNETKVSDKPHE